MRLKTAHDHSRLYAAAVLAHNAKKGEKEATEALVAFRNASGGVYPLYNWDEQYYGDVTGIEKLLGPDPEKKGRKK